MLRYLCERGQFSVGQSFALFPELCIVMLLLFSLWLRLRRRLVRWLDTSIDIGVVGAHSWPTFVVVARLPLAAELAKLAANKQHRLPI